MHALLIIIIPLSPTCFKLDLQSFHRWPDSVMSFCTKSLGCALHALGAKCGRAFDMQKALSSEGKKQLKVLECLCRRVSKQPTCIQKRKVLAATPHVVLPAGVCVRAKMLSLSALSSRRAQPTIIQPADLNAKSSVIIFHALAAWRLLVYCFNARWANWNPAYRASAVLNKRGSEMFVT